MGNAVSAMCAAIEIYNKPKLDYRDETAVILIVNAWELALKAVLSKNKRRIYYKKKRGQPYKTYSITDALNKVRPYFPASVDFGGTEANLRILIEYRDTAVHFYHKEGLEPVLYSLAQTSIVNFRDLVSALFQRDLAKEISLSLLPLSFSPPLEPIEFLKKAPTDTSVSSHVRDFTGKIVRLVNELEDEGGDTRRLLAIFEVKLDSTKTIQKADFNVGVSSEGDTLLVQKRTDPNKTHPYRMKDIVTSKTQPSKKGMAITYDGLSLGQYEFQAIRWKYKVWDKIAWCWSDSSGAVTRYSAQFIEFLKRLSKKDVERAVEEYRKR